jgi:uncharacterized protein
LTRKHPKEITLKMNTNTTSSRIDILDVIRGFAIVSVMLLHNIEHFDVYHIPDSLPEWIKGLDTILWDFMFFMFGGKSYAIFALMFGVTFAIQLTKQEKRGKSFRGRFAWRLFILFGFGIVNTMFFQGDILTIYAVIGLLLIPLSKLSEKPILWIASFLMLLPYEWWNLMYAIQHPLEKVNNPVSWTYFGKMMEYIPNNSFWETVIGNVTNGKTGVLMWNWENGRFFTILGLFLFGYILGKRDLFRWTEKSALFWKKALVIATVTFIPLYLIQKNLNSFITSDIIRRSVSTIESTWTNFAFMVIIVSGLTILFQNKYLHKKLTYFSSFGRMSLSNYIIQSVLGASIFYGWGLGMYKYTGATYGILIGLTLTILMGLFCRFWAQNFKQGPLETLWHKATWLGKK